MKHIPGCLIQIHYHNRHGGVRRVIEGYARAFREIVKDDTVTYLICHDCYLESSDGIKIIDIPECDYFDLTDIRSYYNLKNILIRKISEILKSEAIQFPALVIGHNLNLCKNLSLSSAFTELSLEYRHFSFFSVMHDFAEEGRIELLDKINELENAGISVRDELYHKNGLVNLVVPGNNAFSILQRCGFETMQLANPVFCPKSKKTVEKDAAKRYLQIYAEKMGMSFNFDKPVFTYPVRIIPRKNILEAIALVTVLNSGNLLTGTYGGSARSRSVFNHACMLVKEFKLPVIFDIFKVIKEKWKDSAPVELLYEISDSVLSTSVMEGFGYALYEPWFYDCMITGRIPRGGGGYPSFMDTSSFYSRFPIPEDWISIKLLREKYSIKYSKYYTKQHFSGFLDSFIIDGTVDFGFLDEEMQFKIIKNVLKDEKMKSTWQQLLDQKLAGWPGFKELNSQDFAIYCKNREKIESEFSLSNFQKLFYSCFTQPSQRNTSDWDYSCILEEFQKRGLLLLV